MIYMVSMRPSGTLARMIPVMNTKRLRKSWLVKMRPKRKAKITTKAVVTISLLTTVLKISVVIGKAFYK